MGLILDQYFICPRVFLGQVITKNMSMFMRNYKEILLSEAALYFSFFNLIDYLRFLTNACRVKNSVAETTKSPIPGNHWVPLGCRALLGSVKPRQLMLSDRICCQTINVVRQWMLSDSQYHQTGNVVRQSIWSDNRAIPVMKF